MHAAGYYTAHIGKYLNGYGARGKTEVPPGWDEWFGSSTDAFSMYDYKLNCQAPAAPEPPNCGGTPDPVYPELHDYGHQWDDYKTDVETKLATDFIARNTADPNHPPFFLSVAPVTPHDNYAGGAEKQDGAKLSPIPPHRYAERFRNVPVPTPPPSTNAMSLTSPAYIRRQRFFGPRTKARIRELQRLRLASRTRRRRLVGTVVDALDVAGELNNTYIVFMSDNGYMLGEHRRQTGKIVPYEESIRVPLIIRGPGIPTSVHRSQLVGNVDWAPTIVDIAGATPNLKVDGLSLLPAARHNATLSRPLLFEEFLPATAAIEPYLGIRTGHWAYFRYFDGERELYDLSRDPHELNNRAQGRGKRCACAGSGSCSTNWNVARAEAAGPRRWPPARPQPSQSVGGADQALDAGLVDRLAQAVFERYLRLPAQQLLGPGDVGLADLGVVDGERLKDDLRARAGHLDHLLRQLQQRHLVRVADVDRQVRVGLHQRDQPLDQVVDVTEAARLAAVAEDRHRLVLQRLAQEGRDRPPVVRPHPRAVGVEDPHDARVDPLLAVVGHRQRLGVALGLVVDAARADRVDVAPVALGLRVDLGSP